MCAFIHVTTFRIATLDPSQYIFMSESKQRNYSTSQAW